MSLPTISTERLTLRSITPQDTDTLFRIFADEELTRFWGHPPLEDRAAAGRLVDTIHAGAESGELMQWGIIAGEALIGTCTLAGVDTRNRRAELGIALDHPHHGRGYGVEAADAVIAYGFQKLGLHRITADVDPRNAAGRALIARLGFVEEGRLREHYFQLGEWQDGILFGLLADEWESRRAKER